MAILTVRNINKRFGGLKALDEVNLEIEEGTVHAIIGPNGAGKSTLLNCFVGRLEPDTGTVDFDGVSLLGIKPHEINQAGVSRVFQTPEIFGDLSLVENVMIPALAKRDGAFKLNGWRAMRAETELRRKAMDVLDDLGLAAQADQHASQLSRGDKRRLELAMCLIQEPKLLLLDEPTAGMARADTNNTIDLLKEISKRGITMVVIEHDMHVVFSLADKISVLAQGTVIAEGLPEMIKGNPKVQEAYLARGASMNSMQNPTSRGDASLLGADQLPGSAPGIAPTRAQGGQRAFFSVWDIHAYYGESYIVQGISFDVREGEILALLGRNGAGKTSTLRALARVDDPMLKQGEIWLDHVALHEMKSHEAARSGIGLVPEDRRIIPGLTVEENLDLAQIAPPKGWSKSRIFELFPRLAERRKQEAVTLSGGEQQMLAVARALARDVKLLLLDEPYEGLAPVIVQEIEKTLEQIKELGMTTIIVEQNAIAALHLADRAIILDMGQIVFDGNAQEVLDNADLRQEYLAI